MDKELEQKLITKYKYMFEEIDCSKEILKLQQENLAEMIKARQNKDNAKVKELKEKSHKIGSYYPIVFGFEHNNGWYNLLDELMDKIAILDVNKTVRIHQIKEKLGELRFYINTIPLHIDTEKDDIQDLIDNTEAKSSEICEICGKPGKLCITKSFWYKTVCKEHRKLEIRHNEFQEYTPIQHFHNKQEVILIPWNSLVKIDDAEFREDKDTWYYTLDDGDIRPQEELKRIPHNKYYENWYVTHKDFKDTEFLINSKNFDPESGWTYTIESNQSVTSAREEDLKTVHIKDKSGYDSIKTNIKIKEQML